MKKFVLILVILGVTAAIAYLFGTDSGRVRRYDLLSPARKTETHVEKVASDAADSAKKFADNVSSEIGVN